MDKAVLLRQTVAELLKTDVNNVTAGASLSGGRLGGSIGRATLDAAIRRRLNVECPAAYTAATFGELEAAMCGTGGNGKIISQTAPTAAAAAKPAAMEGGDGGAWCGVDIEMVENIPVAADPWENEFHRQTFTAAEIAYCQMQENPRMHLAARWCAKEALKKCDPAFAGAKANTIELWSDGKSAPVMRVLEGGTARRLPHGVSISHTPGTAVAMVVLVRGGAGEQSPPATTVTPSADEDEGAPAILSRAVWAGVLIALGISVWALIRTF